MKIQRPVRQTAPAETPKESAKAVAFKKALKAAAAKDAKPKKPKPTKMGRPFLTGERLVVTAIRLTEKQRAKFLKMGGSSWMRDMVDQAK